jgi:hypothetical protein
MATKRSRSTTQRIVDTISALVRQPFSDESNEVPTAAAVRRSKAVAAGPRRRKASKAKAKAKVRVVTRKKAKPAARKKKR